MSEEGRARAAGWGGLLLLVLALGCATTPPPSDPRIDPSKAARPDAPADYDVLVGELALAEGRFEAARDAFERAAEKDPASAYIQRKLGRLAAQLDDLEAAATHAERAVELDPEDEESRLFLGRLHRIRRDVAGAEAALLGEDGEPVSTHASLLLYQVYLERNRLEEALSVAQRLVEEDPEALGGYMAVATVYDRMGRPAEAERALREAVALHPDRLVLYSRLARLLRASGERQREIEVYRELLERHPHHYGTLVGLGEAQVALGDLEGAIATYREIAAHHPNDLQSLRRLASLEFAAERYDEAAALLEEALTEHPEHHELAYSLGQVRQGAGDAEAALAAFARVEEGHPLYAEARLQRAGIFEDRREWEAALEEVERVRALRPERALDFHVASLRARTGDFEGGRALLESMLAENPEDDEILYQLGVLHGTAKRVDEALDYMQRALELNPENAQALNYVGYTWAERGENLDEAERMIQRAIELRPNDGYIIDSLGWVYYMRARPLLGTAKAQRGVELLRQAREHLLLAAELTGGDPVVSEHLGDVHLLLNDKQRALEFYKEAVALEYREEEQPNLLDKLEVLRRELEEE